MSDPTTERQADLVPDLDPLRKVLAAIQDRAPKFAAEHGSAECIVTTTNPIVEFGIRNVAGFRVEYVDMSFVGVKTNDRTKLEDHQVYFHRDDDPTFGSKADPGDDSWDDGWERDDDCCHRCRERNSRCTCSRVDLAFSLGEAIQVLYGMSNTIAQRGANDDPRD